MGSPVSPIVANLYMEWFEETALQSFPFDITVWKRYVDDTFVALCASLIEELTKHINSLDPSIQFTREEEADQTLPMLDTLTTRNNEGRLSFTVNRKQAHTDLFGGEKLTQPPVLLCQGCDISEHNSWGLQ